MQATEVMTTEAVTDMLVEHFGTQYRLHHRLIPDKNIFIILSEKDERFILKVVRKDLTDESRLNFLQQLSLEGIEHIISYVVL